MSVQKETVVPPETPAGPVGAPTEAYGLRPQARDFPMMLVLSFVYPCNAQCPHCPYTNSEIRKEYRDMPFMPAETFCRIADEAGRYGAYLRISGGGEPMLHPQATELLCYAKRAGCKIGLISNGSRFTAGNSAALLEAGLDMFEISVDACDEATYRVVRKGLDWATLVGNVQRLLRLRDAGYASRIVTSVVNQQGIDVEAVERFWLQEIGVDYVIKRKFLTWGINTTLDAGRSADPSVYLDPDAVPCPFLFERLNIDTRGNVMVCGYDISANTSMGNVNEQSIHDIWHGPGFRFYRDRHLSGQGKSIPLCSGCPDWKYRSWTHNYWKVLDQAEQTRQAGAGLIGEHDDFRTTADPGPAPAPHLPA